MTDPEPNMSKSDTDGDPGWLPEVEELERRRALALHMGGEESVKRQHARGRLTIRERIDALIDPGSFFELSQLKGNATMRDGQLSDFVPDGYVAGLAKIDGRDVMVGGEDFTVRGGSQSGNRRDRWKSDFMIDMAREYRVPIVKLLDGAGANVQGIEELGRAYLPNSFDFTRHLASLGEVPVIAGIVGSVAGGPAGWAALTHWTCMPRGADLFVAGPSIVARAIGREMTKQELGGTQVHTKSGMADNEATDEYDCFLQMRRFLSYMPQNVWELPPYREPDDTPARREEELLSIVPRDQRKPYNMKRLIELIVDRHSFFELTGGYGRSLITGLARMNGHVVGVLGSNPRYRGGAMDMPSSEKMTHFMEMCDCFHIPILNFVDVPGFMIGPDAENSAVMRYGMRAMFVAHQITVPQISIYTRRCYGFAGTVTSTPARLGLRLGWPSGEWGSIPIEGGVETAYRRIIDEADDPIAKRDEIEAKLRELRDPMLVAHAGGVEDLIDPRSTREVLNRYLDVAIPHMRHELGPKPHYGVRP